jgi:hypothetical protein
MAVQLLDENENMVKEMSVTLVAVKDDSTSNFVTAEF